MARCTMCGGTGRNICDLCHGGNMCRHCNGSGLWSIVDDAALGTRKQVPCPACHGSGECACHGRAGELPCVKCWGTGTE